MEMYKNGELQKYNNTHNYWLTKWHHQLPRCCRVSQKIITKPFNIFRFQKLENLKRLSDKNLLSSHNEPQVLHLHEYYACIDLMQRTNITIIRATSPKRRSYRNGLRKSEKRSKRSSTKIRTANCRLLKCTVGLSPTISTARSRRRSIWLRKRTKTRFAATRVSGLPLLL